MSTELETQRQADIEALLRQQEDEYAGDTSRVSTPILKVTQHMTKEVKSGDVDAGEFYNTLTGESMGDAVDFIVAFYQRGRSASDKKTKRYYIAIGTDVIPDSWADLVGAEFVGTRFDEHPDAEEQYKRRVNAKEIEWGKGPLISTTYNYTGLVLPNPIEGDDSPPEDPMPVRISFLRTTTPAHVKLKTLKQATMRNKMFYDVVFTLSTALKPFKSGDDAYVVNVNKGRETTAAEREMAFEVAQAVAGGRAEGNDEAAAAGSERAEPDAKGGLAV